MKWTAATASLNMKFFAISEYVKALKKANKLNINNFYKNKRFLAPSVLGP